MVSCTPRGLTQTELKQQVDLVKKHGPELKGLRIKFPLDAHSRAEAEAKGIKVYEDSGALVYYTTYDLTPQKAWNTLSLNVEEIKFRTDAGRSKEADYRAAFNKKSGTGRKGSETGNVVSKDLSGNIQIPEKIRLLIPGDYQVGNYNNKSEYLKSNPLDLLVLRATIWHEIMEAAGIFIQVYINGRPEEFRDPVIPQDNYIHDQVIREERVKLHEFYAWPDDPPFNWAEKAARQDEDFARHSEQAADIAEGVDSWGIAASHWGDALEWWNRAAESWMQVGSFPAKRRIGTETFAFSIKENFYWKDNKERCEKNAEAAKERRDAALKKAEPWWEIINLLSREVEIRYGSWPHPFKAEISDASGNVVESLEGPTGKGVITWGRGQKSGIYFIKVIFHNVEPRIKKIIIY